MYIYIYTYTCLGIVCRLYRGAGNGTSRAVEYVERHTVHESAQPFARSFSSLTEKGRVVPKRMIETCHDNMLTHTHT